MSGYSGQLVSATILFQVPINYLSEKFKHSYVFFNKSMLNFC